MSPNNTSDGSKIKILFVEPDPLVSKMYASYFINEGFEVVVSGSDDETLLIVERENPDVIFIEIVVGGLVSFDVVRQLKLNPQTSGVPVIAILTNEAGDSYVKKAKEMGIDTYLMKSEVKPAELLVKINKTLKVDTNPST